MEDNYISSVVNVQFDVKIVEQFWSYKNTVKWFTLKMNRKDIYDVAELR